MWLIVALNHSFAVFFNIDKSLDLIWFIATDEEKKTDFYVIGIIFQLINRNQKRFEYVLSPLYIKHSHAADCV